MAVQLPDARDDRRRCDFCDSHVTDDFRRTYGNENNRAERCSECDSWARIKKGSAAGRNLDHPDPQDNPHRRGGQDLQTRTEVVADGGERP